MQSSENGELSMVVASQAQDLDEYTTTLCLTKTIGEVLRTRERSGNARTYFVCNMIWSAMFEQDMGIIETIVKRIDGTAPVTGNRDSFANIMGDAIDDVLDMECKEQTVIDRDDPVILALAKVVFHIATQPSNGNPVIKREKQKAIDMVYERTNGRRVEPVRPQLETLYEDPEWLTEGTDGTESEDAPDDRNEGKV